MIDLTKITHEQANRIECALLILENDIKEQINGHQYLANCDDLPATTRNVMKSNAEWWEAVYKLIYQDGE